MSVKDSQPLPVVNYDLSQDRVGEGSYKQSNFEGSISSREKFYACESSARIGLNSSDIIVEEKMDGHVRRSHSSEGKKNKNINIKNV